MSAESLSSRRDFLGYATSIIALLRTREILPSLETQPITFEKFGIHDTPNVGGSIYIAEAFKDFKTLGAKWILGIDPSENFLKAARDSGVPVIIRTMFPNNEYDPTVLKEKIEKYKEFIQNPIIQIYNEVNNTRVETGGTEVDPEGHIVRDFVPAAKQVIKNGGRVLLTPVAQRAITPETGITDIDYKRRMNQALVSHEDFPFLASNLFDSIHSYIFNEGENPQVWESQMHRINVDTFGFSIPIFITEKGPSQEQDRKFDQETYAKQVVRMLTMKSMPNLPVVSEIYWLYSNDAQRPTRARGKHVTFELAAWKTVDGPTPVFQDVSILAGSQRQKELAEAGVLFS